MNRKGKKSLSKAKAVKEKPKSEKLAKAKSVGSKVGSKAVKAKAKNPRPKKIATPKKAVKSSSAKSTKNKGALQPKKKPSSVWLAVYAIIVTVGVSTLLGTAIALATSLQAPKIDNSPTADRVATNERSRPKLEKLFNVESLGQEITLLKQNLEQLIGQYPDLKPEIFVVDLDNNGFVSINGEQTISSASTIKLPILVAFFQDVDRGKVDLTEQLTMTKDLIGEGSGNMRYEKIGTKFSALETATRMMTVSDNTATNMLIERLGGMEVLNQRFTKLKLESTSLNNPLPDLTGTNTTSPQDLGNLLVKIDGGEFLSLRSRDRLRHIMGNIVNDSLLPQGLEPEALITHKTGDIKSVLGDVGIIDMPNGKRYIASVLVKRPDNSPQAQELIQKISRQTYQYFQNQQPHSFRLKPNAGESG